MKNRKLTIAITINTLNIMAIITIIRDITAIITIIRSMAAPIIVGKREGIGAPVRTDVKRSPRKA